MKTNSLPCCNQLCHNIYKSFVDCKNPSHIASVKVAQESVVLRDKTGEKNKGVATCLRVRIACIRALSFSDIL